MNYKTSDGGPEITKRGWWTKAGYCQTLAWLEQLVTDIQKNIDYHQLEEHGAESTNAGIRPHVVHVED
jgi:hypothetical protein